MKAIVSVLGKDKKGIIARVSGALYDMDVNVEDLSQTILQDYFTMIMAEEKGEKYPKNEGIKRRMCETGEKKREEIKSRLRELGENIGVQINIQIKDIFDAMHRIDTPAR